MVRLRLLILGLGLARSLGRCCQFWILPSDHGSDSPSSSLGSSHRQVAMVQASALKLSRKIMLLRTAVQQLVATNTK